MEVASLLDDSLLTGLLIALYAIAFWSGGIVIAAYLWRRWRNEDDDAPA